MSDNPTTIALFVGKSSYSNVRSMAESLAVGFAQSGHRTEILDVFDPDFPSQFQRVVQSETLGALI